MGRESVCILKLDKHSEIETLIRADPVLKVASDCVPGVNPDVKGDTYRKNVHILFRTTRTAIQETPAMSNSNKLRIVADRSRCCGYGLCAQMCPEVYKLDENGIVYLEAERAAWQRCALPAKAPSWWAAT